METNKLYWIDSKGRVMEAIVHMSHGEFCDAVQELQERSALLQERTGDVNEQYCY